MGRGSWVQVVGRGSWVVGVGVGVGVGEELIMIIHMKLIATFALCRIALRRHPVKSPKNYRQFSSKYCLSFLY